MQTTDKEYHEHLAQKYLPGRRLYLQLLFYPKLLRILKSQPEIIDLGCGMGEFLFYAKAKGINATGIDNNQSLIEYCNQNGLEAKLGSILEFEKFNHGKNIFGAICDNVLEHLNQQEIKSFFEQLSSVLAPNGQLIVIVPHQAGFKRDPTHKTFVDFKLLNPIVEKEGLKIRKRFFHPFNIDLIGKFFYLNMQVFVISRT